MTEQEPRGVPLAESTAADFMMVRAALVRRLGGANEALVWTRIDFRLQAKTPPHVDADGVAWWPATREELAEETGLSPDQAKRAVQSLIDRGFIEATEHRLGGNYDRTKSYRTLVQERPLDWANSPNESGRNRPMDRAESPNVPTPKTYTNTEEETPLPPNGIIDIFGTDELSAAEATVDAMLDLIDVEPTTDELFDEFWQVWPRKEAKKTARRAFDKALAAAREHLRNAGMPMSKPRPTDADAAAFITAAAAWWARQWRDVEQRNLDRIPHPSTWLNGERWTDERPTPAQTDRRTPTRTEQNLAVVAKYAAAEHVADRLELDQ